MKKQEIYRIECAIRNIQTAIDVDQWAVKIAVGAMKKQIPVKPVKSKTARWGMGWDYHDWECPTCGAFLAPEPTTKGDHHCECGQALIWKGRKTRNEEEVEVLRANYVDAHYKQLREAEDTAIEVLEKPEQELGEWLPEYGDPNAKSYYCSACNFYYTTTPEEMNFCPHCGNPKKKMTPIKIKTSKYTVEERWQKVFERRHTYCKDCERSIYGKYANCSENIENNGLYVRGNQECRLKIKKGQDD